MNMTAGNEFSVRAQLLHDEFAFSLSVIIFENFYFKIFWFSKVVLIIPFELEEWQASWEVSQKGKGVGDKSPFSFSL